MQKPKSFSTNGYLTDCFRMTKTQRTYVSSHVYQTPSGAYYDDRREGAQRRLSNRRGAAAAAARIRMQARVRDEDGKLGFKQVNVKTDGRAHGEHNAKYYDREAQVAVSYDPDVNVELATINAIKHLDEDEPEIVHFNVELQ
jgi:hypothetical protein